MAQLTDTMAAWVLLPAVLVLLSLGLGRLVGWAADDTRLRTLELPIGFAAIVVLAQLLTVTDRTAMLAGPALVSLALLGLLLNPPRTVRSRHERRPRPVALVAAAAVYVLTFLPVIGFGRPTYLGWIKAPDTATTLALADHLATYGRTTANLAPSTHEAVVSAVLGNGDAVGAHAALGVVARLVHVGAVFALQPYVSFAAAIFAVAAVACLRRMKVPARLAVAGATAAGASSLLAGFAWWGGVTQVVLVALIVTAAACIDDYRPASQGNRHLLPLAVAIAAVTAVQGPTGWLWLALPVLQLWRKYAGPAAVHRREDLALLTGATALLAAPTLAGVGGLPAYRAAFAATQASGDTGNFFRTLDWLQLGGVWPVGDFRAVPALLPAAQVLAVLAIGLATFSLWRHRGTATLPATLAGALVVVLLTRDGSVAFNATAVMVGSCLVVLLASEALNRLVSSGRPREAGFAAAVVLGGLAWSLTLGYHEVWPAPYAQVKELQAIDAAFAGAGPALMVEYNPLAARDVLRNVDTEGAADSHRSQILLLSGDVLQPNTRGDLDYLTLASVEQFPTLVVRNDPRASRPPANYSQVWTGTYYSVWQSGTDAAPPKQHVPLGTSISNGAVPDCATLKTGVGAGRTRYVAAPVTPSVVVDLTAATLPAGWRAVTNGVLPGPGTLTIKATVPTAGAYAIWLDGWIRGDVSLAIDGGKRISRGAQLNPLGSPTPFGDMELASGPHTITLTYGAAFWRAGSGGLTSPLGPLILQPKETSSDLITVSAATVDSICGKTWDWVDVY